MKGPDFTQKTKDTVAKRAGYRCSNPDCRVATVGPNTEIDDKSTNIGEAAHIYGARPNSKRFNKEMTDNARAEITNAIWLCGNCHKKIDTDEKLYTSETLFRWREVHEEYTLSELGNQTGKIRLDEQNEMLEPFKGYPHIVKRIVIDKPDGWEFMLTAELMRHLNGSTLRKIDDLKNGLYLKPLKHIDQEDFLDWLHTRLSMASELLNPLMNLFNKLVKAWGEPGESGNIKEILHISEMISKHLEHFISFEEEVHFVRVPEGFEGAVNLLKNQIGNQLKEVGGFPNQIDDIISSIDPDGDHSIDNPMQAKLTMNFELSDGWEKNMDREIRRVKKKLGYKVPMTAKQWALVIAIFVILWILIEFM